MSADPALGSYLGNNPRKLSSQGGIFNPLNLNLYSYTRNNPVIYYDPDGYETTEVKEINGITKDVHLGRNKYQQGYAPRNLDRMRMLEKLGLFKNWGTTSTHNIDANKPDTKKTRKEAFHPFGKGENLDFRGAKDTIFEGMQFVYNSTTGGLVTDSLNKGTYDFFSPERDPIKHMQIDVEPWFEWGNGPADNPNNMYIPEETWGKIENIYNQFEAGTIKKEEAQKEIQNLLPKPEKPKIENKR